MRRPPMRKPVSENVSNKPTDIASIESLGRKKFHLATSMKMIASASKAL